LPETGTGKNGNGAPAGGAGVFLPVLLALAVIGGGLPLVRRRMRHRRSA
jgi:hypothetical protein